MSAAEDFQTKRAHLEISTHLASGDYTAAANAIGRLAKTKTAPKTFPDAGELAMRIGGPCTRFVTDLPSLDQLSRGGLPAGRLVAVAGPPGTGKTTVAIDLARRAACAGWHVGVLCHDEARETVMIRWGQLEGLVREDLERGDPNARQRLAEALRGVSVFFADGDDDEASIEDVGAEVRRRAGDAPSLLVVDSLQTVRAAGASEAPSRREAIDAVVRACKLEAKRGSLVIVTSEVSRGWYRSKAERIDPLAAFKESGGIEYGLALGLVLQAVEDEVGVVDVFTAKNRVGTMKPTFRLRQDFDRASFSEIDAPARKTDSRVDRKKNEIVSAVRKAGSLKSKRAIYREVGGTQIDVFEMIDELVLAGRLALVADAYRVGKGAK